MHNVLEDLVLVRQQNFRWIRPQKFFEEIRGVKTVIKSLHRSLQVVFGGGLADVCCGVSEDGFDATLSIFFQAPFESRCQQTNDVAPLALCWLHFWMKLVVTKKSLRSKFLANFLDHVEKKLYTRSGLCSFF